MPGKAVACGDCLNGLVTVVYGQIECIYIRTTGAGLAVVIGIGTRGGIDRAVPRVTVTSGDSVDENDAMADGQMQGVCAGAAIGVGVIVGIRTTRSVVCLMPNIAVTGSDGLGVMGTLLDGEVKCYRTVTA